MKDIAILGGGGFAREVAWLIDEINRITPEWNLLGYIEADAHMVGEQRGKYAVVSTEDEMLARSTKLHVVIGIGNPKIIGKISQKLIQYPHLHFPNLVHPSVLWDSERVQLGQGNIICAGNILTTDIQIDSFNILNLASTYGHDIRMGNGNVINPGVNMSGNVTLGNNCLIGTGAVILEGRTLGNGVTVGGGAVVTKDVPDNTTVVGIPAKPLEK